ncbi:MAG TPA: tetratricopeptide repeat protein [Bryobacteraceae bacterium]|nr:tetratricopeptide repeat protein [Bryobacteraceae bacterium]
MSLSWKFCIFALTALLGFSEESVRHLYERARLLQERNRNLDEAIRIYGRVVERARDDRSLAARAQFSQGMLYLRLGRDEQARQAFRKVIMDFSDQPSLVREARTRLGVASMTAMSVRQVWATPDSDNCGGPSRDGRYLSFTDWSTGDVAIRDLATGENRRVTHKDKGFVESLSGQAPSSVFAPDSKHIAYWWVDEPPRSYIGVAGIDGSAPRVLCRFDNAGLIRLTDWSPDGKHILACLASENSPARIVLVSAANGSIRTLMQSDAWPGRMSFSRDGKFILHDGRGSPGSDVYLLSIETGRDIPVVRHPAYDFAIGWSPGGEQILFGSDRTGPLSLWTLAVKNGEPRGEPRLIRQDAGKIEPLGVTRTGVFYYWLKTGLLDLYSAAIDPETAAVLDQPKAIGQRLVGSNRFPGWSPDGKSLLYQSEPPGLEPVIVIRSLDTGRERELKAEPPLQFKIPRWNAAGDAILISGILDGKKGIYRMDPKSGAVALAVQLPADKELFVPSWSADGKILFGRFNDFDGVQRMDVATGTIETLYNPNDPPGPYHRGDTGPSDPEISPDGRTLLFQQRDRPRSDNLLIMPAQGGTPRVLASGKWPERWFPFGAYAWTPDSRRILFVQRDGEPSEASVISVIAAAGGELRRTGIRMNGIRQLRLHPDGKHIVFLAGKPGGEVWTIDNLF